MVIFCLTLTEQLVQAEVAEKRFLRGDAIINGPFTTHGVEQLSSQRNPLSKVRKNSFSALVRQPLSAMAVRVSVARKIRSRTKSVSNSKLHNPCNEPVIKRLLRVSKSLTCEPNWEVKLTLVPNDTLYSSMYSADSNSAGRINLPEAWSLSTGSSNVVVGIIDTGISYNHVDLAANIWSNPGEIADNDLDDDGNGYVDDIHGIDPVNNDSDPLDDHSHGTAIAGTIGAVGNNSLGVVGINWNVRMVACKAFNSSGVGYSSDIVSCLNYFTQLKTQYGINILATNNSYGGYPYLTSMYNAIAATRDADIAYIAGAGNNGTDNDAAPFYPANYNIDNVISVGATDNLGNKASFSNYGATSVDISAPGVSVLTTILSNQYGYYNGTSIATPHVTGAIALIRAYHPDYVYSQALASVLNTGTSIPGLESKSLTGALLNVGAALAFAAPTPAPTSVATPNPTAQPANKLDISVVNARSQSKVTCALSVLSGMDYKSVSGRVVKLAIKGEVLQRSKKTDSSGLANFVMRLSKGKSYRAQCLAKVNDAAENQEKIIRSSQVTIRLRR